MSPNQNTPKSPPQLPPTSPSPPTEITSRPIKLSKLLRIGTKINRTEDQARTQCDTVNIKHIHRSGIHYQKDKIRESHITKNLSVEGAIGLFSTTSPRQSPVSSTPLSPPPHLPKLKQSKKLKHLTKPQRSKSLMRSTVHSPPSPRIQQIHTTMERTGPLDGQNVNFLDLVCSFFKYYID
jgi:hypothetical protein